MAVKIAVTNIAADGGGSAAGPGPDHNPAGYRVSLVLHLLVDSFSNIVVAAPVRGPFGISELVHIVAPVFFSRALSLGIALGRIFEKMAFPAVDFDLANFGAGSAARHYGN